MIIQAATTAFFAVGVFVVGQFIVKFVIEPIHEQSKVIGEIAYALIFHARVYANPGQGTKEEMDQTAEALRKLASHLVEKTIAVPWYQLWATLKLRPSEQNVSVASKGLIYFSNSVRDPNTNHDFIISTKKNIVKALRITFPLQ